MGKRLRFTIAKAKAFNHVVPDFGIVANTTSVSLAWKCLWKEIMDWISLAWYQNPCYL